MGYILYRQSSQVKRYKNGLCTKQVHLSAELEVGHLFDRVGQCLSMSGTVSVLGVEHTIRDKIRY
jgi:hypothetical protein